MATEKRSPLKDKPLRNPGQSLDDQISDVFYDRLMTLFMMALLLIIMAIMQWLHALNIVPPSPWLYTAAALVAIGYAAIVILRALPTVRALRQGRDGEKGRCTALTSQIGAFLVTIDAY